MAGLAAAFPAIALDQIVMPTGEGPGSVAIADVNHFNGEGRLDVVTGSWGNNQILVYLGDGAGDLILPGKPFVTGKRPYQRLRSADSNKDGKPDVVTTDLDSNAVSILLGDGKGGLREAPGSPFPAGIFPWSVAVDDINKDGNLDLVVLPYRVATGDLNGDGKDDIVVSNNPSGGNGKAISDTITILLSQ